MGYCFHPVAVSIARITDAFSPEPQGLWARLTRPSKVQFLRRVLQNQHHVFDDDDPCDGDLDRETALRHLFDNEPKDGSQGNQYGYRSRQSVLNSGLHLITRSGPRSSGR